MHRRILASFAVFICFAGAQAAVAPSANALAECRLEYSVAQGELKKLKVIEKTDQSDDYSYDIVTEYDAAKVRPFGVKPTRFVSHDYEDPDGQFFNVQAELALPYDRLKPKVLKAFGMKECDGAVTAASRCRLFLKKDGGKRHVGAELMAPKTGVSRFDCTYYD